VPASLLVKHLRPDINAMGLIFDHCRGIGHGPQLQAIGQSYAAMLEEAAKKETGEASARRWRQASTVHQQLGSAAQGVECLCRAVEAAPNDFAIRHALAGVLYAQQRYDEAYEHYLWCATRKPHDDRIRRRMRDTAARMDTAYSARTSSCDIE
jgi:thioredoxin-like negative regulator of GroEL